MDENELDNNITGGEAFLEQAARQAMHNFVYGDKESLKVAIELEHERRGFKHVLERDQAAQKETNTKNGRSKR